MNNKKNVGQTLSELAKGTNVDDAEICSCALKLWKEFMPASKGFPVDVELLAEKLGIRVTYQSLNDHLGSGDPKERYITAKTVIFLSRLTGQQSVTILIDSKLAPDSQRYVLAEELAHCLIHENDAHYNHTQYAMPLICQNTEEIIADKLATFLTLPVPLVLDKLENYMTIFQDVPFCSFHQWIYYLALEARIPLERAVIGYERIRILCGRVGDLEEIPYKQIETLTG